MPIKIKLGTRVLPWEDLLVPDTASPFLDLGPDQDVEIVLAVLSGMGPTVPKLVQLDASGRLLLGGAAANIGNVTIQDDSTFGALKARVFTDAEPLNPAAAVSVIARNYVFNNSQWERMRDASSANIGALLLQGIQMTSAPGMWQNVSTPAAGVQASASRGPAGAGIRHVCTGIIVTFGAIAAPVATALTWNLRDGTTGVGTILASGQIAVPAAVFQGQPVYVTDLAIPGTAATAMTLEFSAALPNLLEGCTLLGFDTA